MPQLQAAIVGQNNTRAAVTGQEELLVKVNSTGTFDQNVVIKSPIGTLTESESVSVTLNSDQYKLTIIPIIISSTGSTAAAISDKVHSISFASNGTADALVSFDGGLTYVGLPTGTTVNMDAGGLNNYYQGETFYYDTNTNAGASLLITYNLA
jgi:hypothetical protein